MKSIHEKQEGNGPDVEWPYPLRYDEVNEVETDVLILGGGMAGCFAAIEAARKGVKVAIVDKASIIRSGSGGAGVDHWHGVCDHPAGKITADEMLKDVTLTDYGQTVEFGLGPSAYILFKESYDTLMDMEKMGLQIRDVNDDFTGAEFRDEETKLLYAYDYEAKNCVRFMGAPAKPVLYNTLKKLGVKLYEHVMSTSLLNENGRQGSRVVGATGINVRTGEFYVFNSRTTLLAMASPSSLWGFQTELKGFASIFSDPNCVGDGHTMAWRAGVEFALMENTHADLTGGNFSFPAFGRGNAANTWYACNIVDSNGKEIPWVDNTGKVLKTISERYRSAQNQNFHQFNYGPDRTLCATLIHDLPERIRSGEYVLPFYADLSSMPEHERRAIWGLMVGNEGKTRVPVYEVYNKAGFDPEKDMLQVQVYIPENGKDLMLRIPGLAQWRSAGSGGPIFDWDLKTNLDGLFAAGSQLMGGGNYAGAAVTGRYAGRKMVEYALNTDIVLVDRDQQKSERNRVYAPLKHKENGVGWKELRAGIARIMQEYCGLYKSDEILNAGLKWFEEIRKTEIERAVARNPHELWRTLECMVHITAGEMIMHASLARKASSHQLDFHRIDYPEPDPTEWSKFVTTRLENGEVKIGEKPLNYWLKAPYSSTYDENYRFHCGL
jgi:succinate dehydrogenase/fumarate reductase flavoprotein subunit